jgi:peptidoglycan/LPS O-acetylase OafA/YrhL
MTTEFMRNALTWSPSIAEVATGRDNNFNLVRFVAASMVILFHEFGIAPTPGAVEPFYWLTRGRDAGGSLAVLWFFIISGFLITQSFLARGSTLLSFLSARVLRIFPALWVAVPFTIIVSSFASPVPWGRYLTHPQTLKYWLHNSLLWDLEFHLPGAFLHVPVARDVNGSLWTLPVELRLYWVCAGLGLLGLYAIRPVFNAFLLTVMLVGVMTKVEAMPFINNLQAAQWELAFLFGMGFYVNRNEIRLNIPVALLLLGSTYFIRNPDLGRLYIVPAMTYAVLCFSLHPAVFFRPFTRLGDYSYGLYIYAFPLQQQMVFYHPGMHWIKGMLLTYPIILGVAILSWHLVEKPALSLKKYFRSKPPSEREARPDVASLTVHA